MMRPEMLLESSFLRRGVAKSKDPPGRAAKKQGENGDRSRRAPTKPDVSSGAFRDDGITERRYRRWRLPGTERG